MMKIINRFGVLVLAAAVILMAASCETDEPGEQPELPPIESLRMDFSDFENEAPAKKTSATYGNFVYSALTVAFWNVYATAVSIVPVTAYGLALQVDPVYLGDQSWEWAFNFGMDSTVTGSSESYEASLVATRISNEEFSATMTIAPYNSEEAGVKFFDGIVRYDHTHATWTIYKEGTISVLEIDWDKDYETADGYLKYTYAEPGKAQTGSYIMYEEIPEQDLDAAYTISLAEGMTNIEWNREYLNGRVMSPNYFQDQLWHCWDSAANGFQDIICE